MMGKQKKVEVRTVREVLQRDLEDPEFRVEWERTALARAVALAVLRYRNDHQLSQRDLAHKLDWKQPAVARLESGEVNPALETLYQLASRLRLHFIVQVAPTRQRHIARGARRGEVVERVRTSEGSHVLVAAG
jgi:ribosome-binding protein aMBF1 (putative translation factor)